MKTTEEKILSLIKVIIAWTQRHCPEIVEDEVNLSLAYLSQEGHLVHIGNDYAITETRYAENQAVKLIAELIKHNVPPCEIDVVAAMALAEEGLGFTLSASQSAAVLGAMTHRAVIITGRPETGKVTVLRVLCDVFEAYSTESIHLLAPTDEAARRLSAQTGRPAMPIHTLLHSLEQEGAGLGAGLMVIDEASMLSIPLLFEVLRALPHKMRLVLVGDPSQRPTVGCGQAFNDLLSSGLPVYRLTGNCWQEDHNVLRNKHGKELFTSRYPKISDKCVPHTQPPFVCPSCGERASYNVHYDAYYCASCDIWLEPVCTSPLCAYCAHRPDRPSDGIEGATGF